MPRNQAQRNELSIASYSQAASLNQRTRFANKFPLPSRNTQDTALRRSKVFRSNASSVDLIRYCASAAMRGTGREDSDLERKHP